jgi:hypothetical protein
MDPRTPLPQLNDPMVRCVMAPHRVAVVRKRALEAVPKEPRSDTVCRCQQRLLWLTRPGAGEDPRRFHARKSWITHSGPQTPWQPVIDWPVVSESESAHRPCRSSRWSRTGFGPAVWRSLRCLPLPRLRTAAAIAGWVTSDRLDGCRVAERRPDRYTVRRITGADYGARTGSGIRVNGWSRRSAASNLEAARGVGRVRSRVCGASVVANSR